MSAEATCRLDADTLRKFDSDGRLLPAVRWELSNYSLRWCCRLAIVNQFRRSCGIDCGCQGANPFARILVHQSEVAWLAEEDCLELVELDVWDEPNIAYIGGECLLPGQNPLMRNMPLFLGVIPARKPGVQSVQVEHGRETGVGMRILPE